MKKIAIYFCLFCLIVLIYVLSDRFYKNENKKRTNFFVDISLCLLLSFIASLQFNSLFGVFYPDSAVFGYIGKMMHEGLIPYKDLFDHKGVILYFIQYLAAFLKNISVGIWLIEIVNLSVLAYFCLKTIKLFTENKLTQFVTLAIICCICTNSLYEGGNYVEEYALPWIALSMFLFFKWFKYEELKFTEIVWIGISFSIVFFLRPNMIALWVALIPVVAIKLISQKKWLDLFKCIGWFCAGMVAVCAVLLIYFIKTNSLKDMLETYFVFNFGYTASRSTAQSIIRVIVTVSAATISLAPSILLTFVPEIKSNNKIYSYNLLCIAVTLVMSCLSGRMYLHYGIILIPTLVLPLVLMLEKISEFVKKQKPASKNNNMLAQLLCMILVIVTLISPCFLGTIFKPSSATTKEVPIFLKEKTKQEDDILILGNKCKYYLFGDRTTKNKYFYQLPLITVNDDIYNDFMAEIKSKPSDYVICFGERADNSEIVSNLGAVYRYYDDLCLSEEYDCLEFEGFYVYQKME